MSTPDRPVRAQDLRQALNRLDPERPLRTAEELEHYFVARPNSPIDDLRIVLEDTDTPQKILFTGHRGSGKSTELAKLTQQLDERFVVVRYSIKSILNLFDLSYVDVVLSLGLELFRQAASYAASADQRLNEDVVRSVLDFTKEITREVQMEVKEAGSAGLELSAYVVKLSSKLQAEDTTRTAVRERVQYRLSDLLESIDHLAADLQRALDKRLLFIVEDLDKTDLDTAKTLFYGHATSLLAPPVSIIYTFPAALRHDNDFMQVESNFPQTCVLPNMKTRRARSEGANADDAEADDAHALGQILTRRVEPHLIAEEAVAELARLSGGIPRELITLARQSCVEARKTSAERIEAAAVERAARRKRMDYEVLLSREQVDLLRAVRRTNAIDNDPAHRALLHNLSVLEYRNGKTWYDVHPLAAHLIDEAD